MNRLQAARAPEGGISERHARQEPTGAPCSVNQALAQAGPHV
jgi:hypothetical protein